MANTRHSSAPTGSQELEAVLAQLRPELHRYCARMTGSAIEGEDVLQDVLLAATRNMKKGTRVENIRAWLYRIAHNTALNHIRSRDRESKMKQAYALEVEVDKKVPPAASVSDTLQAFLPLTPSQRSTVILRDVLGYTAAEVADLTNGSLAQVKSALHRGRLALKRTRGTLSTSTTPLTETDKERLNNYALLFNGHKFDQLRDLLAQEISLELVARERRSGKTAVGNYFGNYSQCNDWWLVPGQVEGRPSVLVFDRQDPNGPPRYFVLLEFADGTIRSIRDFRYADYAVSDANWNLV